MKPHKHAEVIRAFADGATIQVFQSSHHDWADVQNPSFLDTCEYRVKPRVYPKSSITPTEAYRVYTDFYNSNHTGPMGTEKMYVAMQAIAHAAVKQFIIDNNL